ncbi:MAG: radical SAM protein [Candidatus Aenigmatarchaeota archaeon]
MYLRKTHNLIPHLRVLVTPYCNARCSYCTLGGEDFFNNISNFMTPNEIKKLVKIGVGVGFKHIKISGGEPLLRDDIIEIVKSVRKINGIKNLNLGTNGILLEKYAKDLKEAGLDSITVSLNTLNKKVFINMLGVDGLEKVIRGLYACKKYKLPMIINVVAMNTNKSEFPRLIRFIGKLGATAKIMELNNLSNFEFWQKEYIPLSKIKKLFKKYAKNITLEKHLGGIGIPMDKYVLQDGTKVLFLDPKNGIYYAEFCKKCSNYPCQDGIFALRITHDGKLKKCFFPIPDNNPINILVLLRKGSLKQIKNNMREFFNIMKNSKRRCIWSHKIERKKYQKISQNVLPTIA